MLAGVMMLAGIIKSIADDVPRLRLLAGFLFILGSILLSFGGISTYKFFKHHKVCCVFLQSAGERGHKQRSFAFAAHCSTDLVVAFRLSCVVQWTPYSNIWF